MKQSLVLSQNLLGPVMVNYEGILMPEDFHSKLQKHNTLLRATFKAVLLKVIKFDGEY